jgi:phosphatidylglycerophosphatase A
MVHGISVVARVHIYPRTRGSSMVCPTGQHSRTWGGMFMSQKKIIELLEKRGVTVDSIADIVYKLQKPYNSELKLSECIESVQAVLKKREVQYTLYTGIALDELAEKKLLPEPLQEIMEKDESLYGVDETMAIGIISVYGMIGLTSFGYLDKEKMGIIKDLNNDGQKINVFLDDLVAALTAAASARIAHNIKNGEE